MSFRCVTEKDAFCGPQASGWTSSDPRRGRLRHSLAAHPLVPAVHLLRRFFRSARRVSCRLRALHWTGLLQLLRQSHHLQPDIEGFPRCVPLGGRLPEARQGRWRRCYAAAAWSHRRRRHHSRRRNKPCGRRPPVCRRKDPTGELRSFRRRDCWNLNLSVLFNAHRNARAVLVIIVKTADLEMRDCSTALGSLGRRRLTAEMRGPLRYRPRKL